MQEGFKHSIKIKFGFNVDNETHFSLKESLDRLGKHDEVKN